MNKSQIGYRYEHKSLIRLFNFKKKKCNRTIIHFKTMQSTPNNLKYQGQVKF